MAEIKLPAQKSASPVGTIVESNSPNPSSARTNIFTKIAGRRASYQASPLANRKIQVGGGVLPKISCARGDLLLCGCVLAGLTAAFFAAKEGFKRLFSKPEAKSEEDQEPPIPPTVQRLSDTLNSGGEPKEPLIPNILYHGGRTVIGGRTNVGKSIIIDQLAVESSRGYGEFVNQENATPQQVILIDGEMEEDDYKRRFPKDLKGAENITRVSDFNFKTVKEFIDFLRGLVLGLLSDTVVIIDNLAALFPSLTAAQLFDFYNGLKKIQREASVTISYIIADHTVKVPKGLPLDETHLAGSSNTSRFATNIAIIDWNARGKDYRIMKFPKQRKDALPDDVLELVIDESEYLHFNVLGNSPEEDVLCTKDNRRRWSQDVIEEDDENEEVEPEKRPWTEEDTDRLIELAATLDTPDAQNIGFMMDRNPVLIYRKAKLYGVDLMKKPRGRKPKQKPEPNLEEQ